MSKRYAVAFLALTAALFAAWVGYLAYLAHVAMRDPIVLSRPQFLASDLDIVAQVDGLDGPVTVVEVRNATGSQPAPGSGDKLEVKNLEKCRNDWKGAGPYILPLTTLEAGKSYLVAGIPHSPGYPPAGLALPPRIYPYTPQTDAQLREIRKPAHN